MKNFNLSLATVLAMSTFAMAGGDIEPVMEPVVEAPIVVAPVVNDDSGFYIGGAYSQVNEEGEFLVNDGFEYFEEWDFEQDAIMFQAGYKINKYIAIEGRYWIGMGDSEESYIDGFYDGPDKIVMGGDERSGYSDFDALGIYVKPMFPVTEQIDIYGLLGYADFTIDYDGDEWSENGFSWGLGASFDITNNLSVFADYVVLYDDSETEYEGEDKLEWSEKIDTWNFGLTYKF